MSLLVNIKDGAARTLAKFVGVDANGKGGLMTAALAAAMLVGSAPPAGMIYGATISNNSGDATNDIDFAAGYVMDSTNAVLFRLAAGLTKQLDGSWVAGNNHGGRMSAAAIADTCYHCFLIYNATTGAVDCGFDVSPTAPTLPAGYTHFRRIGSINRASSAIRGFRQQGDHFWLTTPIADESVSVATAEGLLSLVAVPNGVKVRPFLSIGLAASGTAYANIDILYNMCDGDGPTAFGIARASIAGLSLLVPITFLHTNTSRQIRRGVVVNSGTLTTASCVTRGWYDDRGRQG